MKGGAALGLLLLAAVAAGQNDPVVNTRPHAATRGPDLEQPLYYPMSGPPHGAQEIGAVTPEVLLWRLRELHSRLEYAQALPVAEQLVIVAPDHPASHYNHACVLARLRRQDAALDALARAIDTGWRHVEHTSLDPDLRPLSEHPRFSDLLQRMARLRGLEQAGPGPLRTGPVSEIAEDLARQAPGLLERHHVPGAVVGLVRGSDVMVVAFGLADRGSGAAMSPRSRFRLQAPLHLLALMASLREQQAGRLDVVQFVRYGMETRTPRGARRVASAAAPSQGELAYLIRSVSSESAAPVSRAASTVPLAFDQRMYDLLQTAVETTADQTFAAYCREHILEPAGAGETDLSPGPPGHDRDRVCGHTAFGTPLGAPAWPAPVLATTAGDLARLIGGLCGAGDGRRAAAPLAHGIERLAEAGEELGLQLTGVRTIHGLRLEMTGEAEGQGCLLRWYPDQQVGVAVLYNSQGGLEAARRLAALTLGGV